MSTLKVAHASDLHCCERNRLDDWIKLHQVLVEQVEAAGCELTLLTGDLFHAKSTPAERNAMADFLEHLASVCPVVIVKGNHDAAGDLDIFAKLGRGNVIVMDRPGTEVIGISEHLGDVAVIGLPWFDRAHLVSGLEATVDAEASRNLTIDAARQLLTVLRAHVDQARDMGYVPVLAGHVLVAGSETSTGQTLIGTTVELSPADLLEVGAEYAALGHIHLPQEWHGGRVAYAGSTWPQNFGENHPHGWRLVTFEDGRFVSSELQELPARRLLLAEVDWVGVENGSGVNPIRLDSDQVKGALVRVRYRIEAERLHEVDEDRLREQILAAGAHSVKLEAVIVAETRIRSEAIVAARSNMERVEAYLSAKGIAIDDATRARIQEKLASIESRFAAEREVAA